MLTPRTYFASTRVPWAMLSVMFGAIALSIYDSIEMGAVHWYQLSPFILPAVWVVWLRRRRPVLTIGQDEVRINPSAKEGEEHIIPCSKISSISIAEVGIEELRLFEYEYVYDRPLVQAIRIEVSDGRVVPPLPLQIMKRQDCREVRSQIDMFRTMLDAGAFVKNNAVEASASSNVSPLGIGIGETYGEVVSKYGEEKVVALPATGGSGHSTSVAVALGNIDGFLTADFDGQDRLCAVTWQADSVNRITEAMVRHAMDQLEMLFGQSDEPAGRLGWKRRDGNVVRELRVEGEDAPYNVWYTEHPV